MSLQMPNDFNMSPCKCHICGGEVREDQPAVEHSGWGQIVKAPHSEVAVGYASIWLHLECATVLVLRLSHDVVRYRGSNPRRVVDVLQDVAKVNAFK